MKSIWAFFVWIDLCKLSGKCKFTDIPSTPCGFSSSFQAPVAFGPESALKILEGVVSLLCFDRADLSSVDLGSVVFWEA